MILFDCIATALISGCILKNLPKLVNFCVAILILKIEENMQHFSILCFIISRKVKTQLKYKKRFVQCYGDGAVTDQACQKWFVKFHAGDFSLHDAPTLGRPVEVDSNQIETLIENNQCYTTWEMANILKISKLSVENHLH